MKLKYLILLLLGCYSAQAQYYDKNYVKDLRYRLLVSYFQETRSTTLLLTPDKKFEFSGKRNLTLGTSPNLLSGLLLQTNNSSVFLAGTTPQSDKEIQMYGKQSSKVVKFTYSNKSIFSSFNYIKNKGFYDQSNSQEDNLVAANLIHTYNSTNVRWISWDLNYYKNHRQFAIGMPTYFGLRQLKSKYSLAGRLCYNNLVIDNEGSSFFADSITNKFSPLLVSKLTYNGMNFSLSPSLYLVAFKRLFLYTDVSFGLDLGNAKSKYPSSSESDFYRNISFGQGKVMTGFHSDRFIAALYYSYINQTFKAKPLQVSATYHNFGFIIGYRFNIYKNLPWEKD